MKSILKLIRRFKRWQERGELYAEQRQIRYWREYGDRRWPRIAKRLAELDAEEATENGATVKPFSDAEMKAFDDMTAGCDDVLALCRTTSESRAPVKFRPFGERHPEIAGAADEYLALFDTDGLAGEWKGRA